MLRRALLCAAIVTLTVATPAFASPRSGHDHRHHSLTSRSDFYGDRGDSYGSEYDEDSGSNGSDEGDSDTPTSDTGSDVTVPEVGVQASLGGTGKGILTGTPRTITASNTGFSIFDNSPPGTADICCARIHSKAGGTGTRLDPISVAVPGSGGQGMELAAGTLIYYAAIRRYGIIEDSGATKMSNPHFDWWVGGQGFPESSSEQCMSEITKDAQIIVNPAAGLPVTVGPLTGQSGCHI